VTNPQETAENDSIQDAGKLITNGSDEGPGCLPAFMAVGALLLIGLFITCGIATWYIFQKRTELAIRTLEGDVIPTLQESGLQPSEKAAVLEILQEVVEDGKAGRLENWQSSGIMERLIRAPLLQWGDLETLEALVLNHEEFSQDEKADASKQLGRLRRSIELGEAGAVDVNDVLAPIFKPAPATELPKVDRNANAKDLRDCVLRAKLIADRGNVPDASFQVDLAKIIRREVEAGKSVGGL
jgi:hypothetical protein